MPAFERFVTARRALIACLSFFAFGLLILSAGSRASASPTYITGGASATPTSTPSSTPTFTATPIPTQTSTLTPTSTVTPITLPYCWISVPGPGDDTSAQAVSAISSNDVWVLANNSSAVHWNGTGWTEVPILPFPGLGSSVISDLVAISDNDIWAVGAQDVSGPSSRTLTMHWNGHQWSVVPSPNGPDGQNSLYAVDASDSNNVWAVGDSQVYEPPHSDAPAFYDGLILRWNGTQWDLMDTHIPVGDSSFESLQVTSPSSVWVGGWGFTSATRVADLLYWNGTTWINETSGLPSEVTEITALVAISPNDVWAAAVNSNPSPEEFLFIHSDGSTWTAFSSLGLDVSQLAAVSSEDVWTSGAHDLLHWNGTTWGRVSLGLPDENHVWGLSAISSNDVWAVGVTYQSQQGRMLAAHYTSACIPTPAPTATATSTPAPPPCPGERFTDVCPNEYFYSYVQALTDDGILYGYASAPPCRNSLWIPCFNPNNPSSRGQISKIVSLAAGFSEQVSGQQFQDVPPGSTFYTYTERMAERGIINGYLCGGVGEPCIPPSNLPYFRTNHSVSRGQLSKMVALAFQWNDPPTGQVFEDVPPGAPFYTYTVELYNRGLINGYPCGGPNDPCVPPGDRPYFRPSYNVLRGQTAKIVQLARTQPTATPTPTPTATEATPTFTPTSTPTVTDTVTAMVTDTSTPPLPTGTPAPTTTAIKENR